MNCTGRHLLAIALTAAIGIGIGQLPSPAIAMPDTVDRRSESLTVPGTTCPLFPADNYWRTRVDRLPLAPRSPAWVRSIGSGQLHPDFGPSFGEQEVPYGIGVTVVDATHPFVGVDFDYGDESDHVPYPFGPDTFIEGGRAAGGDRHAIVVTADTCRLYETWDTHPGSPRWHAGSGATWNLRSNRLRPSGWTSADAAGLPILPGLLTVEDVASGELRHAIRFTAPVTRDVFVWPARHQAGSTHAVSAPPMGARFRLRRDFSLTGWSPAARVVLRGMKRYGLVLADNGSPWYFQGTADSRWDADLVDELKGIPARAFQAVDTRPMQVARNSGAARPVSR